MNNVSEPLAGRADVLELETLSLKEIRAALPRTVVESAIVRGGFPELSANPDIDHVAFYISYLATYWNAMYGHWLTLVTYATSNAFYALAPCVLQTC